MQRWRPEDQTAKGQFGFGFLLLVFVHNLNFCTLSFKAETNIEKRIIDFSYQLQMARRRTSPLQQGCRWGSGQGWTPSSPPRCRADGGWQSERRRPGAPQGWCILRQSENTMEEKLFLLHCAEKWSIKIKRGKFIFADVKHLKEIPKGLDRCSYLRGASHPHHGHDGWAETQGFLQAAFQQAEIFQLRTTPAQY